MIKKEFIALCKELDIVTGSRQIWANEAKENLQKIIKNFLNTGKIEYTKIFFEKDKSPKKISFKAKQYTLYLWKAIGRYRKRDKSIGGNIIEEL